MIKAAARFFLLSLVFQALEGSPDPLDTINVHFHLGDDTETGGEHGIEPPDSEPANDAKPESASTPAAPPPISNVSGGSPGPAPETGAKGPGGSAGAGPKPESGAKSKEDSEEDTEHEDYHMPEPEPETKPKWGPKWG